MDRMFALFQRSAYGVLVYDFYHTVSIETLLDMDVNKKENPVVFRLVQYSYAVFGKIQKDSLYCLFFQSIQQFVRCRLTIDPQFGTDKSYNRK